MDVPYRCRPTRTGTALAAGRLPPFLDASGLGRYDDRNLFPIDAAAEPFLVEDRVVSIGAVRFPAISEKSSPERSCHESTVGNLPCPQRIDSILLSSPLFQDIPRRDLVQEVAPGRPFHGRLPVWGGPFPAFPAFPQDPPRSSSSLPSIPFPRVSIPPRRPGSPPLPLPLTHSLCGCVWERRGSGDEATRVTFEVASRVRAAWTSAQLRSRTKGGPPREEGEQVRGHEGAGEADVGTMWCDADGMEVRRSTCEGNQRKRNAGWKWTSKRDGGKRRGRSGTNGRNVAFRVRACVRGTKQKPAPKPKGRPARRSREAADEANRTRCASQPIQSTADFRCTGNRDWDCGK